MPVGQVARINDYATSSDVDQTQAENTQTRNSSVVSGIIFLFLIFIYLQKHKN